MAVMEQLLLRNKKVRMVNRSGKMDSSANVEVVRGDATNELEFSRACSGASVIYHCAKAPYTEWPEVSSNYGRSDTRSSNGECEGCIRR